MFDRNVWAGTVVLTSFLFRVSLLSDGLPWSIVPMDTDAGNVQKNQKNAFQNAGPYSAECEDPKFMGPVRPNNLTAPEYRNCCSQILY